MITGVSCIGQSIRQVASFPPLSTAFVYQITKNTEFSGVDRDNGRVQNKNQTKLSQSQDCCSQLSEM